MSGTAVPDQSLFGKPLGKFGEAPPQPGGGGLHFGIGGSLQGYFDELFALNAGGLFGIGAEIGSTFNDAFDTIFGFGAGTPGQAFEDGYGSYAESANLELTGFGD
jgi:hypothetical protein